MTKFFMKTSPKILEMTVTDDNLKRFKKHISWIPQPGHASKPPNLVFPKKPII